MAVFAVVDVYSVGTSVAVCGIHACAPILTILKTSITKIIHFSVGIILLLDYNFCSGLILNNNLCADQNAEKGEERAEKYDS